MQFCAVWQVLSVGLPWGGQQMRFIEWSQSIVDLHVAPTPPSPLPPSVPPLELELLPPLELELPLLELELAPLLELELAPLLPELLPLLELELELEPPLLDPLAPLEPELEPVPELPLLLLLVASPVPPSATTATSSPQAAIPAPQPTRAAPATKTHARAFDFTFVPPGTVVPQLGVMPEPFMVMRRRSTRVRARRRTSGCEPGPAR